MTENSILSVKLRHRGFSDVKLATRRIGIFAASHRHNAWGIVSETRVDFKLNVSRAPAARVNETSRAVSVRISTLNAPVFDAVKCQSVVEAALNQVEEIPRRVGHRAYKHLNCYRTFARLQYDDRVRIILSQSWFSGDEHCANESCDCRQSQLVKNRFSQTRQSLGEAPN